MKRKKLVLKIVVLHENKFLYLRKATYLEEILKFQAHLNIEDKNKIWRCSFSVLKYTTHSTST